MSFLIAMLLLYNRETTALIPINFTIVNNWYLKALVIFVNFAMFILFSYLVLSSFDNGNIEKLLKNTNGYRASFAFNIFILVLIFLISSFNFGKNGNFSSVILQAIFLLFLSLFIFFRVTNSDGEKYIKPQFLFTYCIASYILLLLFNNAKDFTMNTTNQAIMNSYFTKALIFLFGCGVSAGFIYWIIVNVGKLDSRSGIISLIINILLIITILGLAYKAFFSSKILQSFPIVALFVNTLLYIPCIFVNIIEYLVSPVGGLQSFTLPSFSLKQEYQNTNIASVVMLIIMILLFIIYFGITYVKNKNVVQGGKQLLNEPVNLNTLRTIGTYGTLNGSDNFNYQYAISFWFYIDSSQPSSNASRTKYTSLLSYGNKPNIKYNSATNTLVVVENQTDGVPLQTNSPNYFNDDTDENNMRIIYKKIDVPLQKWNNVIINYTGGTLDIFYNGDLVKSSIEVIPYMKLDNLTIGEDNGLIGGICNTTYFNKALNATQIYYIYNSVKNKTPPTLYDSNFDVFRDQINLAGEGDKIVNSKIEKKFKSEFRNIGTEGKSSFSDNKNNSPSFTRTDSLPSMTSSPTIPGPSDPTSMPPPSSVPPPEGLPGIPAASPESGLPGTAIPPGYTNSPSSSSS